MARQPKIGTAWEQAAPFGLMEKARRHSQQKRSISVCESSPNSVLINVNKHIWQLV